MNELVSNSTILILLLGLGSEQSNIKKYSIHNNCMTNTAGRQYKSPIIVMLEKLRYFYDKRSFYK